MADLKLTEGFTETKTLGEIQVLEPGKPLIPASFTRAENAEGKSTEEPGRGEGAGEIVEKDSELHQSGTPGNNNKGLESLRDISECSNEAESSAAQAPEDPLYKTLKAITYITLVGYWCCALCLVVLVIGMFAILSALAPVLGHALPLFFPYVVSSPPFVWMSLCAMITSVCGMICLNKRYEPGPRRAVIAVNVPVPFIWILGLAHIGNLFTW